MLSMFMKVIGLSPDHLANRQFPCHLFQILQCFQHPSVFAVTQLVQKRLHPLSRLLTALTKQRVGHRPQMSAGVIKIQPSLRSAKPICSNIPDPDSAVGDDQHIAGTQGPHPHRLAPHQLAQSLRPLACGDGVGIEQDGTLTLILHTLVEPKQTAGFDFMPTLGRSAPASDCPWRPPVAILGQLRAIKNPRPDDLSYRDLGSESPSGGRDVDDQRHAQFGGAGRYINLNYRGNTQS